MNIKTSELSRTALDWAVAKCEGIKLNEGNTLSNDCDVYAPSTDWSQGGPIIERENIELQSLSSPSKDHRYGARKPSLGGLSRTYCMDGPTPLVAAMRCFVASKLGDEIELPEELK